MSFAYREDRGVGFLDEIRQNIDKIRNPKGSSKSLGKKLACEKVLVDSMDALLAQDSLLQGFESQYKYIAACGRTPSKAEAEINRYSSKCKGDEVLVLTPKKSISLN